MKISSTTLGILKNYAGINPSLIVKAGNTLRAMTPQQNMVASAVVAETFPAFAIYDLNQFLSVLAINNKEQPDLDFQEKSVIITGGDVSVEYFFAQQSLIQSSADADIMYNKVKMPPVVLTVSITKDQLDKVLRTASILASPEVSISSRKDHKIVLGAQDNRNKQSNHADVVLGDNTNGDDFSIIFKRENIKFFPADYTVDIAAKGIVHMKASLGDDLSIEYYVAAETTSSYVKHVVDEKVLG